VHPLSPPMHLPLRRRGGAGEARCGRKPEQQQPEPGVAESDASSSTLLTVKIRQPSHEFTFGVGMTFVSYPLVLTPVV
jgi:hypothetical protein